MSSKMNQDVLSDSSETKNSSQNEPGQALDSWVNTAIHEIGYRNLLIGDVVSDFEADTTIGRLRFHEWIGNSWCLFFSHPKNFTPVCTTELGYVARLQPEFEKRDCKIIGLSVDPVEDHLRWAADIADVMGTQPNFPIIADPDLTIAKQFGMICLSSQPAAGKRTAIDNMTVRTVHIIGPDKCIKAMLTYPMSSGRNFFELLRLLDAIQLSARQDVVTPAHWENGQPVIIRPDVSDDDAKSKYPDGWEAPKPYMRFVPQPGD